MRYAMRSGSCALRSQSQLFLFASSLLQTLYLVSIYVLVGSCCTYPKVQQDLITHYYLGSQNVYTCFSPATHPHPFSLHPVVYICTSYAPYMFGSIQNGFEIEI